MSTLAETQRCIFCLRTDVVLSEEHVFPEAIGGTITIHSVCRGCNSRLGTEVDAPLCDDWLFKAQRYFLRLAGKTGKVPNIFEEGEIVDGNGQKVRVKQDGAGRVGTIELVPLKFEVPRGTDGILRGFTLSVDETQEDQVPAMIAKIAEREARKTGRKPRIETTKTRTSTVNPRLRFPANINLDAHRRGYLKIAYELGSRWLGPAYIDDPMAENLRSAIWSRMADAPPIQGQVGLKEADSAWTQEWPVQGHHHLAFTSMSGSKIALALRVLGVLHGVVLLTKNAERYPQHEDRFLTMDPRFGTRREQPFHGELEMWASLPDYELRGRYIGWAFA